MQEASCTAAASVPAADFPQTVASTPERNEGLCLGEVEMTEASAEQADQAQAGQAKAAASPQEAPSPLAPSSAVSAPPADADSTPARSRSSRPATGASPTAAAAAASLQAEMSNSSHRRLSDSFLNLLLPGVVNVIMPSPSQSTQPVQSSPSPEVVPGNSFDRSGFHICYHSLPSKIAKVLNSCNACLYLSGLDGLYRSYAVAFRLAATKILSRLLVGDEETASERERATQGGG